MSLCVLTGTKVTTFAISFFTLVWTHSVEKVEWQEDWKIINSKLKIVESRVKGSGAGSLVAWALSITELDPIKFGLIFERRVGKECTKTFQQLLFLLVTFVQKQ